MPQLGGPLYLWDNNEPNQESVDADRSNAGLLSERQSYQDDNLETEDQMMDDTLTREWNNAQKAIESAVREYERETSNKLDTFQDEFVNDVDDEVMNIGHMEVKDLEFDKVEGELMSRERQRMVEFSQRQAAIEHTWKLTHKDMMKHHQDQLKKIVEEEADARRKVKQRQVIIEKEFKWVSSNIGGVIKEQKSK